MGVIIDGLVGWDSDWSGVLVIGDLMVESDGEEVRGDVLIHRGCIKDNVSGVIVRGEMW